MLDYCKPFVIGRYEQKLKVRQADLVLPTHQGATYFVFSRQILKFLTTIYFCRFSLIL